MELDYWGSEAFYWSNKKVIPTTTNSTGEKLPSTFVPGRNTLF